MSNQATSLKSPVWVYHGCAAPFNIIAFTVILEPFSQKTSPLVKVNTKRIDVTNNIKNVSVLFKCPS